MRSLIDACVLYPTVLREIVLGVARAGLIVPLWSERLLEEWARTAARHGGAVDETLARGEIAALALAFPKARVAADPALEARLWLPDGGDIHVLATAITAQVGTIITLNLRDFPARELAPHGVAALHPDAVLHDLWLAHPGLVAGVVAGVHATAERLSGETMDLRALLKRVRLPRLARALGWGRKRPSLTPAAIPASSALRAPRWRARGPRSWGGSSAKRACRARPCRSGFLA